MKRVTLTEAELESAREVIATFLDEAAELAEQGLGDGVLARVWRGQAEELAALFLEPERDERAIVCACGAPAREIGVRGLVVCDLCAIGEKQEILAGPDGLNELLPFIDDSYTFCLLSGRALTVMDAHQLAASGELAEIRGIGPRRRAEIEEALRLHAAERG